MRKPVFSRIGTSVKLSQCNLSVKDKGGRACHKDMVARLIPPDLQVSAPQAQFRLPLGQACQDRRHKACRGAGAAGPGLSRAALPDPHLQGTAVDHPDKLGVDSARKQRMVFNLKYYQEMKYEEMSEIFGTSVGALKASYHHAVKKIEKFLEDID